MLLGHNQCCVVLLKEGVWQLLGKLVHNLPIEDIVDTSFIYILGVSLNTWFVIPPLDSKVIMHW